MLLVERLHIVDSLTCNGSFSLISEEGFFDVVLFKWFWILENPGKIWSKSFMSLSWTCFESPKMLLEDSWYPTFDAGNPGDQCQYMSLLSAMAKIKQGNYVDHGYDVNTWCWSYARTDMPLACDLLPNDTCSWRSYARKPTQVSAVYVPSCMYSNLVNQQIPLISTVTMTNHSNSFAHSFYHNVSLSNYTFTPYISEYWEVAFQCLWHKLDKWGVSQVTGLSSVLIHFRLGLSIKSTIHFHGFSLINQPFSWIFHKINHPFSWIFLYKPTIFMDFPV